LPSLSVEAQRIADAYQPPDVGRHSAFGDADTLTELLQSIANGNRREVACQVVGISARTLYRWIEQGDAGQEPQAQFVKALKRAEALSESKIVANVIAASEKPQFWAAGMTYLERKYPDAWGRRNDDSSVPRVVVQIGVKDGDVQVSIGGESASALPPVSQAQLPESP
jgi:hypothetical protein